MTPRQEFMEIVRTELRRLLDHDITEGIFVLNVGDALDAYDRRNAPTDTPHETYSFEANIPPDEPAASACRDAAASLLELALQVIRARGTQGHHMTITLASNDDKEA